MSASRACIGQRGAVKAVYRKKGVPAGFSRMYRLAFCAMAPV
jgi:hypothetical protein